MNVDTLVPRPVLREPFRRDCLKLVPASSGCYALTGFDGIVLYVGLAVDLRRRMQEHLDTPAKVASTRDGKAVWFWWLVTRETNKVERTWLNIHVEHEGRYPILNRVYSPTAT